MAKAKKQKNEEQKPDGGGGSVVLHQKLCLSIDMKRQIIYGYTEMKIIMQEGSNVALYADNMKITHVSIDGEPAEFECLPHYQVVEDEHRFNSDLSTNSAADVACSIYSSSLDREMYPNLLIACKRSKNSNQQNCQENGRIIVQSCTSEQLVNGCNSSSEEKTVMLVHINYHIERPETGIHFGDNVLHTDNQIRRAHCWFPCLDIAVQRCTFDLEFTVDSEYVAVSNGNLLYQVLTKDEPPRKTYVYKLTTPVSAKWISLTVGPFEILPDSGNSIISHMCLSPSLVDLKNTVQFFHEAFSHYEDCLSRSFPFGSYKQIFIPAEMTVSSMSLGASTCTFSSHLLFDNKVIDQVIETRIKLAYALARQWFGVYVTAEEPADEWLLDGLAGFLTDTYIKRFHGNNEARYRRYKANLAVCRADVSGATVLSSVAATNDLYGTNILGTDGKIRLWKATAVLQMLEKQMGPDPFRKVLQNIVNRPLDTTRASVILNTKEFRHLANKVGNLERPFLKEFFPRWVESCGCPSIRVGLSYNKRRNIIELAVVRSSTMKSDSVSFGNLENEVREGETGWPGMMSIRVHELDGMYDHPILPMAGESCQLLEIQCHSKLAAKRIQKPKKGSKPDGSDDNVDALPTQDTRNGVDSPLLWIRVDPEMEYLAEILCHQPVQMWINQLEKDKDVVAQSQAIAMLEKLPQLPFAVINALNSFLSDSKAFWRVRIEAAYALARTHSEETDSAGLLHLVKFYKSQRFDADTGLPRPNDFRDVQEYFVLEAIPHAIASIRAQDKKSPREAIEFVLQLLKYNCNDGNSYTDVYWLAAIVESVGELEFGQQGISFLLSLLKQIDRLMQFDSLLPSYNGILTISCIRALAQIALRMTNALPLGRVCDLVKTFCDIEKTSWNVRIEASKVLLVLEYHSKGLDAALSLFMKFLREESTLRGEVKLAVHIMRLCQVNTGTHANSQVSSVTLVALLGLLASKKAFNNVLLRHHLFSILQILAGRSPTLYGAPKIRMPPVSAMPMHCEQPTKPALKLKIPRLQEPPITTPNPSEPVVMETAKDADTVSTCSERKKNVIKIRVRQTASSGKADELHMDQLRGGPNDAEVGPCSSVSVDAPARGANEALNISCQNNEEVNSSRDRESRMSASIASAKLPSKDELRKELQCTADSRQGTLAEQHSSPAIHATTEGKLDEGTAVLHGSSVIRHDGEGVDVVNDGQEDKDKKEKDKNKEKKRKREDRKEKRDNPEYLERKRLKKEKKKKEKELAKRYNTEKSLDLKHSLIPEVSNFTSPAIESKNFEYSGESHISKTVEPSGTTQGSTLPKVRIKIKSRAIGNA